MIDQAIIRVKHALGIHTTEEIKEELSGEPSIKKARKANEMVKKWTGITGDILDDYQELEDERLRGRDQ